MPCLPARARSPLPRPPDALRLLLVQELLARGVYWLGAIFPSPQHDGTVLAQALPALDQVLGVLAAALMDEDSLSQRLCLDIPQRTALRGQHRRPAKHLP
jgi:hypothetical protein